MDTLRSNSVSMLLTVSTFLCPLPHRTPDAVIEQVEKAAEAAPQVADDLDIADLETGEAVPVKDQPEVQVRES